MLLKRRAVSKRGADIAQNAVLFILGSTRASNPVFVEICSIIKKSPPCLKSSAYTAFEVLTEVVTNLVIF
jgi:hypothetical protein